MSCLTYISSITWKFLSSTFNEVSNVSFAAVPGIKVNFEEVNQPSKENEVQLIK